MLRLTMFWNQTRELNIFMVCASAYTSACNKKGRKNEQKVENSQHCGEGDWNCVK